MAGTFPKPVELLMDELRMLPGIGRRAAERLALALLDRKADELRQLGALIASLPETVGYCPRCGALSEAGKECVICRHPGRDEELLCVVENTAGLFSIESGGSYRGRYLVLGGRISPLDGEDGSGLNFALLNRTLDHGHIREVILALGADVEGRATAAFVAEMLQNRGVRITRPAFGLPAGSTLSGADSATIAAAFNGRVLL